MNDTFKLKSPEGRKVVSTIRIKPSYYFMLNTLHECTGLTIGSVCEQCIDYALAHLDKSSAVPIVLGKCKGTDTDSDDDEDE